MEILKVIGVMSGTSLDGLDIAYCTFRKEHAWKFEILLAETINYPIEWIKRLRNLPQATASEYAKTHAEYGHFIGKEIMKFIQKHQIDVDFISSHGHTIFHQPEQGFTAQIGDGASIVAETDLPVINDFRSMDVAFKGQGAPLVPIGDRYLFPEFDFRLNLGGFANISFEKDGLTYAFDIAPANIGLNHFANQVGLAFDKDGELAKSGKVNRALFDQLNSLEYYSKVGSKSLGREWFEHSFLPLINDKIEIEDILRTLVYHLVFQISRAISKSEATIKSSSILITGGGSFNQLIIEELKSILPHQVVLPSPLLINFKEAMIFAFLGVLRMEKSANVFKEVTGALKNSIGGSIYCG